MSIGRQVLTKVTTGYRNVASNGCFYKWLEEVGKTSLVDGDDILTLVLKQFLLLLMLVMRQLLGWCNRCLLLKYINIRNATVSKVYAAQDGEARVCRWLRS